MNSINKFVWLPKFKRGYKKLTPQSQKRINQALLQMERDLKLPSRGTKNSKEQILFGRQGLLKV